MKSIKELDEILKNVEVGDILRVEDSYGKIVKKGDYYNVKFSDKKESDFLNYGNYGDSWRILSLEQLIKEYDETWCGDISLIKSLEEDKYLDEEHGNDSYESDSKKEYTFEHACDSLYKVYFGNDFYTNGKVVELRLLNFNPPGKSAFEDRNGKLYIVETADIDMMCPIE